LSRRAGEGPGFYPITLGTLTAGPKYDISFTPANFEIIGQSSDATLSNLYTDGHLITGFSPSQLTYELFFSAGITTIPIITATTNYSRAQKIITQAPSIPGTAKVQVISEDGSRQLVYEVQMKYSGSGFDQQTENADFKIYPNPNSGSFTFEYYSVKSSSIQLSVIDLTGRTVWKENIPNGSAIRTVIQIPGESKGIFLLKVISEIGVAYRKIVIE
jgi:hypothetical protein